MSEVARNAQKANASESLVRATRAYAIKCVRAAEPETSKEDAVSRASTSLKNRFVCAARSLERDFVAARRDQGSRVHHGVRKDLVTAA